MGAAARDAIGAAEGDEPIAVVRPADARDVSTVLRVARARRSRIPTTCSAIVTAHANLGRHKNTTTSHASSSGISPRGSSA